ncbi:MAG: prephenate dehydratase [Nitrospirota bacterium]
MVEDEKDPIHDYRKTIDNIDKKILLLLNERARVVINIGKIKKDKNADFHVPTREQEILARLEKINPGDFPNEALRTVFKEIMSASLSLESPLMICYLGPEATFAHLASMKYYGLSSQYIPANSIREVFNKVVRETADYGVVPIENSTEGVVNHTLDMFMDFDLKIYSEILEEVSQHLLSKGNSIENIRNIYSHPHAIAQCSLWLEKNMPQIPVKEVYSTAKAAEMCKDDPSAGAIASEMAAELYGLKIVRRNIEDNTNNYTRFLVISKKYCQKTGDDKTSIMFSIKDRVGALYNMLKPFATHKINLTRIESRPSKKKVWEYNFYIDLEGHIEDENVKKALEELEEESIFLKILGSYPIAKADS